jgi:hypothetical protein
MSAKKTATKSAKKSAAKRPTTTSANARKPNALHEKLIKLFTRPNGATLTDTVEAGFKYPAMTALKIAERRGLKVTTKKVAGQPTRYFAKRAS